MRQSGVQGSDQGGLWRIFAWPLLLGVLSGAGLIAALVGDGVWDAASWLLLATPVAAIAWALRRRPGGAD